MTRYLKQYKFLLFLTVLFTAISSLSYVFIAILLQQVMDIVDIGDMDGFIRIMLFSLAYFALMGVFMYLQSLFSKKFICKIMKAVRSKTFMGIERQTIEDYTKNHTADYLSAITNDVKMIEDNFLLPLLQVIQYTIIFTASLAVMIYFDIIVTVCVIIAIAIMLIVPSLFGGLLSERQDKYSDLLSVFTNHVKDLLSGFEVIKSYQMKNYVLSRFETSNEDTIKAKYSVDKAIAANEAVSMVLALLVQVVVVFLSAYFIIIGRISAGALLGMVQVSSNLANPLLIIFSNIPKIKSIKPIAHKLNQLSDYEKHGASTKKSPAFNDVICVEDLHFSYSGYEQQLNSPIAPYFREHPVALCDLTKQDILAFYEKELERVKPTTVKHYHALIHGALNYAVDKNLIPSNPADRIIISKPEPFKGDYYLDSEVLNLFEVIKGHKIELVVLLTAFYGLRRSEVIGLKWSAFDFNHNCFSIRHTVTTCNVKGERVTIKKDKAKNKSSLRTYPLIPFLKERLLEAKKQQEENRKLCGRSYNKEYLGYVCVDVIGNLIKPNYVSSTFGKLLAKNNLRHIRFHDLRHTCASLLLANGVPMEQVKEWLGHSEISTTVDIYGHLQYATKKQSAAAIEQDIVAPMLQNLSAVSP